MFLRNRNRRSARRIDVAIVAVAACLVSSALAQRALDANLNTQSRGRNAPNPKQAVKGNIYSCNRMTGEITYNRANAFNDSSYTLFQRYTQGPFDYNQNKYRPLNDKKAPVTRDLLQKPQRSHATAAVTPAAYVPTGAPARTSRNAARARSGAGAQYQSHARKGGQRGRANSLHANAYSMNARKVSNRVR